MRIVHLSTSDRAGGAARAAFRLHQALLAAGEESIMLVQNKTSDLNTVHQAAAPPDSAGGFLGNLIQADYIQENRAPISNTYFSLGWPGQDLSGHPLVRQADIIHLHWVAGFQSPAALARLQGLGKPLVWTFHDQRAFTGGCHFSAGCRRYETDCASCPQLMADPFALPAANLADQRAVISAEVITVVAPSRWMAQAVRRSAAFSKSRVEVIPYGIKTDGFRPWPRREARLKLGLPADGLQFLFGSDYGSEKRKGFAELAAALTFCLEDTGFRQLVQSGKLRLLCFGRPAPALKNLSAPFKAFGYVDSEETLSAIYSAADLFLLPSLEDNLPNTVLESMSCGTPAAAFNVGGVPEMVIEGSTGWLAAAGDAQQFGRLLLSLASQPWQLKAMGPGCRRHVEENFRFSSQADRCRGLYRELLRQPRPASAAPAFACGLDAGPNFQQRFPRLLRQALTHQGKSLLPRPPTLAGRIRHRLACASFVWRVNRLLAAAASGELAHRDLMARLSREVVNLKANPP